MDPDATRNAANQGSTTMKRQARFWTFEHGSPVRIKIYEGQRLSWGTCERTDEGWSSEAVLWEFYDGAVHRDWGTDGVDCDGRLSRSGTDYCAIGDLESGAEVDGVCFPTWSEESRAQRDWSAEAAGY